MNVSLSCFLICPLELYIGYCRDGDVLYSGVTTWIGNMVDSSVSLRFLLKPPLGCKVWSKEAILVVTVLVEREHCDWVCVCVCVCVFSKGCKGPYRSSGPTMPLPASVQPILDHLHLCGIHYLPVIPFACNSLSMFIIMLSQDPAFLKCLLVQARSTPSELFKKINVIFFHKNIVLQIFEEDFSLLPPNTYLCLLISRQCSTVAELILRMT